MERIHNCNGAQLLVTLISTCHLGKAVFSCILLHKFGGLFTCYNKF